MAVDLERCFTARRSPGYLIRRAAHLVVPRAEAVFAGQDLSLSQWIALKLIHDDVADTSATLSRRMGYNSGATTRLIDQIEQRGLLTRCRRTDDRRVVNLELTAAGVAAVGVMTPKMALFWNDLLAGFDGGEVDMLIALLTRLVERLEADESG